jgi:hypothetical protein
MDVCSDPIEPVSTLLVPGPSSEQAGYAPEDTADEIVQKRVQLCGELCRGARRAHARRSAPTGKSA